jgi:membrane protein involved in colicin uptake
MSAEKIIASVKDYYIQYSEAAVARREAEAEKRAEEERARREAEEEKRAEEERARREAEEEKRAEEEERARREAEAQETAEPPGEPQGSLEAADQEGISPVEADATGREDL